MSYYDDDRWEFDPEGEGRIEPDPTNSTAVEDGSYERPENSLEDDHMDYPDTPGPESGGGGDQAENRCECGAPLDPGRTKCDFCLTNDLEYEKSTDADTDREVTGVIHVLVDASSEANAVCIAQTVFEDIAEDSSTTSIDKCELVAHLDDDLADPFAREWGQLPAAAPVDSIPGQRQLDTIRQNAGHDYLLAKDGNTENNRPTLDPVLFDADGEPITDIEEVGELIAGGSLERTRLEWDTVDTSNEPGQTWIVPAIALEHVVRSELTESSREGRTRRKLVCLECDEITRHTFSGWNEVPHPEFDDTPIWKCTQCQAPQYGPDPDSEPADTPHCKGNWDKTKTVKIAGCSA